MERYLFVVDSACLKTMMLVHSYYVRQTYRYMQIDFMSFLFFMFPLCPYVLTTERRGVGPR